METINNLPIGDEIYNFRFFGYKQQQHNNNNNSIIIKRIDFGFLKQRAEEICGDGIDERVLNET